MEKTGIAKEWRKIRDISKEDLHEMWNSVAGHEDCPESVSEIVNEGGDYRHATESALNDMYETYTDMQVGADRKLEKNPEMKQWRKDHDYSKEEMDIMFSYMKQEKEMKPAEKIAEKGGDWRHIKLEKWEKMFNKLDEADHLAIEDYEPAEVSSEPVEPENAALEEVRTATKAWRKENGYSKEYMKEVWDNALQTGTAIVVATDGNGLGWRDLSVDVLESLVQTYEAQIKINEEREGELEVEGEDDLDR